MSLGTLARQVSLQTEIREIPRFGGAAGRTLGVGAGNLGSGSVKSKRHTTVEQGQACYGDRTEEQKREEADTISSV